MSRALKWIWLAEKCGAGSTELIRIIDKLGSIDEIFDADYDAYSDAGISERLCEDLCDKDLRRRYEDTFLLSERRCQRADLR